MTAKIVSIANQKGGIGKTTTSVNLASSIAMRATPVLLVDLDPQASTFDWVCMMDRNENKLFDYIKALESNIDTIIKNNIEHYQYIIIDCPPRLQKIMAKVIMISDLVVTPVGIGAVEYWAFDDFNAGIRHHQLHNEGTPKQVVFLSNVDSRCKRLIKQTIDSMVSGGFKPLETVHTRNAVVEASGLGKCTIHMDDPKATKEIETLTTEILGAINEL